MIENYNDIKTQKNKNNTKNNEQFHTKLKMRQTCSLRLPFKTLLHKTYVKISNFKLAILKKILYTFPCPSHFSFFTEYQSQNSFQIDACVFLDNPWQFFKLPKQFASTHIESWEEIEGHFESEVSCKTQDPRSGLKMGLHIYSPVGLSQNARQQRVRSIPVSLNSTPISQQLAKVACG